MVTYLAALRFAVNIEHLLSTVQRTLFSEHRCVSALALPPLIPLAWMTNRPTDYALDRIRKTHMVTLAPRTSSVGTKTPYVIPVENRAPIDSVAHALAEIGAPTVRENPSIRLAWERDEGGESPVPLPGTSALWLSVIGIRHRGDAETHRPAGPWWDDVRWTEEYRRRLTVRESRR